MSKRSALLSKLVRLDALKTPWEFYLFIAQKKKKIFERVSPPRQILAMSVVNETTALTKATAQNRHKDAIHTAATSEVGASEPANKRDSGSGRQVSTDADDSVLEMGEEEWRAAEKSLVRKLDMLLMPTLWILYLFNYLDRTNISQAKLSTFEKDLGLVGNQYNVAVSILNIGYMLMQLPS